MATAAVEKFAVFETSFQASGTYENPYVEVEAEAHFTHPDKSSARLPLFWDGGSTWRLRVSPNETGAWTFTIRSTDPDLNGKTGRLDCVPSNRKGSIRPRPDAPHHFQYQNGQPLWFLGDTAWALVLDSPSEKLNREAAYAYLKARAAQGFNVVHCSMLSEAGWGNRGGLPFHDLAAEKINPAYWQEADARIAQANKDGFVCGLALAWGDKGRKEPFAWRKFANLDARRRYARYIAARYGAFDVYFLVAGEWHAEASARKVSQADMRKEFFQLGDILQEANIHQRMIGVHPMIEGGSVREFNDARWMSFGDYQQNYNYLHDRILESRRFNKPVVNSEYAYFLRDQNEDGKPDKENSSSIDIIRHATWDIVMAGGYIVTGFGTTYYGGNRHPGPFNWQAEENGPWEKQAGVVRKIFETMAYAKLEPHDDLVTSATPRGKDRKQTGVIAPPEVVYWCLAEPGKQYIVYARGLNNPLNLKLEGAEDLSCRRWDLRSGESVEVAGPFMQLTPVNNEDWLWTWKK